MNESIDRNHLRFQVLNKLGAGTEAEVLEARDRWTGRTVCLKLTRGEEREQALLQEARLLSGLRSRCFPAMIEYIPGDVQHPGMLVLERKPGKHIGDAGITPSALVDGWLLQLLQGLVELEESGLCHGDISPGNILVSADHAALIDLGLSRRLDDPGECRSGTLGTMAPEVIETGRPGPRSDVFSLAVVAYRLLTGHAPYADNPDEALEAMRASRLRSTAGLPALLCRALAYDPADRPSATEWLRHLVDRADAGQWSLLAPAALKLPLDEAIQSALHRTLDDHARAWLLSSRAADWRHQLDSVLLERSSRREQWSRIDLTETGSLAAWAGSFLQEPARLNSYPLLESALKGKASPEVLVRQLVQFLDDQFDRPGQAFCLLLPDTLGPDLLAELGALLDMFKRSHRNLLFVQVGVDSQPEGLIAESALRLRACSDTALETILLHLPGLELAPSIARPLIDLSSGRPDMLPDLLRVNLRSGAIAWEHGGWSLCPERELQAIGGGLDPADLDKERLAVYLRCAAWKREGAASLWNRVVLAGNELTLHALEAEGWLRDRGDGCLQAVHAAIDPASGVLRVDPLAWREANSTLLKTLFDIEPSLVELCLAHLMECTPKDLPTELSAYILLHSKGSAFPRRRIEWIQSLIRLLDRGDAAAMLNILVVALIDEGELEEAYRRLKQLIRGGDINQRPLLIRMIYILRETGRIRLARRLLSAIHAASESPGDWLEFQAQLVQIELDARDRKAAMTVLQEAAMLLNAIEGELEQGIPYACNVMAAAAFQLGDSGLAFKIWQRIDRHGRQQLSPRQRVYIANNMGVLHLQQGRLEQARREIETAGRTAASYHLDNEELMARTNLALIQIRQGRPEQALRELAPARVQAHQLVRPDVELAVLDHEGAAYAALGMLAQAEDMWCQEEALARSLGKDRDAAEPLLQRIQMRLDLDLEIEKALLEAFMAVADDGPERGRWELLASWVPGILPQGHVSAEHRELDPARKALAAQLHNIRTGVPAELEEVKRLLQELAEDGEGLRHGMRIIERNPDWWSSLKGGIALSQAPGVLLRLRLQWLRGRWQIRQEDWLGACQSTGEAIKLLGDILDDLPEAWRDRLERSPLLEALRDQAIACNNWLNQQEREHDHSA